MAIELSEKQIKDGWQIVKFGEIAKEVTSIYGNTIKGRCGWTIKD